MTNEIPKGRAKGGYARAACLSQDQRSAIASEAAKIRWKDHRLPDVPRVLEGFKSELNLAGVKIPCAVISGPRAFRGCSRKTASPMPSSASAAALRNG